MAKSNYITRDGWHALDKELKYLWKEERPRVTQSVSEAAAQGDRSENAEYIYGKKRLREIDRRVRFLSKRLDELKIVDPDPRQEGKVYFGAWVTLEDDDENIKTFRLDGPDEFDPAKQWISISVQTPGGIVNYCVLSIKYYSE